MVTIIPAILSTTIEDFQRDYLKLSHSEGFTEGSLHIDFMDGEFVLSKSIDPEEIKQFSISFNSEAHLMVEHPLEWLEKIKASGFSKVIFHAECKDDQNQVIDKAKSLGLEVGIALNHETGVEKLNQNLAKIDEVLAMSIKPGLQGQPFIEESLEKIKQLAQLKSHNNFSFAIGVDGHVDDHTAPKLVTAGADILIVGSFLLEGDSEEKLERLWEVLK